ncbi:MAG: hypothetical protein GX853_03330 [Chloroflexi bacterium]|nr:hypothetical protein [Chloroflexota bacterium]
MGSVSSSAINGGGLSTTRISPEAFSISINALSLKVTPAFEMARFSLLIPSVLVVLALFRKGTKTRDISKAMATISTVPEMMSATIGMDLLFF